MTKPAPPIVEAQKAIGAVLQDLEAKTSSEVRNIALEDMVDIDPGTGSPVVQKGVEITLTPLHTKRWAT